MFVEGIQGRQGTALVPAPPISHEELPEGVNGIVKIRRRPQEGHEVVPRDLICPELAQNHRLEFDVDVDLLQELLQNLPILTREFNIAGTLHLQLAPVDLPLLLFVRGQQRLSMRDALGHVWPVADQLVPHFLGHAPWPDGIIPGAHGAGLGPQLAERFPLERFADRLAHAHVIKGRLLALECEVIHEHHRA